jgi:hypothetical protein
VKKNVELFQTGGSTAFVICSICKAKIGEVSTIPQIAQQKVGSIESAVTKLADEHKETCSGKPPEGYEHAEEEEDDF